jgi:inositol-phosphate transport system permease protein
MPQVSASSDTLTAVGTIPGAAVRRVDWDRIARKSRWRRRLNLMGIITFLGIVSIPVLFPYFWMLTISVSAKTGGVESFVLWRSTAVLVPAVIVFSLVNMGLAPGRKRVTANIAAAAVTIGLLIVAIGPYLHWDNYRFFWTADIVKDLPGRGAATGGGTQFPWIWSAFLNSFLLATALTFLVVSVSTLAGYYLSRFKFRWRAGLMQGLLVMHAFPAMTLVIPIFLIMYWVGLIDTITGVLLVLVTLELPFSIFIMKGFFDAVSWDIEMAAITDGASRRQAFWQVVLPQVRVGMIAIGVFAFIKGWEEYVFVRTLLFEKSNWMMSLYLFWVADDIMGVDYGIVAAASIFYVVPSLLLYIFCQKYLVQMSFGGVKG